jgi:hypothetical protein
LKQNRYGLFVK